MNKLLFIVGPTATGKTSLALSLAKKFNGELISNDARQIYKGMDVGTGKDLPENAKPQTSNLAFLGKRLQYYVVEGINIWGYDLVEPNDQYSTAHFYKFAWKTIKKIWGKNNLPIIVGGSGQYNETILKPPASLNIVPNPKLRARLQKLTTAKLQQKLKSTDPIRLKHMNKSDRHNSRRLIRAIEISLAPQSKKHLFKSPEAETFWIGLKAPLKVIDQKIKQRVLSRIKQGMTREVKNLLKKYPGWRLISAFTALGYQPWRLYVEGYLSRTQAISMWTTQERQYARRQLTWFKKQPHIHWFDVSKKISLTGL